MSGAWITSVFWTDLNRWQVKGWPVHRIEASFFVA